MNLTPMMQHYVQVKNEHPNHLLFYRLGDFYELFFDDAITVSQALHLTLTKRGQQNGEPIPMAGLPYHCAEQYIARLLKQGYTVAICDQVTDAKFGPVKREITRIITPGTLNEDSFLDAEQESLLASLYTGKKSAIAIIELCSGSFTVFESENLDFLLDECDRQGVKELLIHENISPEVLTKLKTFNFLLQKRPHWEFHTESNQRNLLNHFGLKNLDAFGLTEQESIIAAGLILQYLNINKNNKLKHIHSIKKAHLENCILIDQATRAHLELNKSTNSDSTLLSLFAPSYTPMGIRLLSKWMIKPTNIHQKVQARQEAVKTLRNTKLFEDLSSELKKIADLERIVSRLGMSNAKPIDLINIANAQISIKNIILILNTDNFLLSQIRDKFTELDNIIDRIVNTIIQPAVSHMRDGGYIISSADSILEHYTQLKNNSETVIAKIIEEERSITGLNLNITHSRSHGLYISMPKSQSHKAPSHYKRTQTLKNEERFTIEKLEILEKELSEAQTIILQRERICYDNLLEYLQQYLKNLQLNAYLIAQLDALMTMAKLSMRHGYVCPDFSNQNEIVIDSGRHPVLENKLEYIVDNDLHIDHEHRLMILSGPNMGGKSTYMRQIALLTIMAYMGSFVPAIRMRIGFIDRIMTRIGARDEISKGRSTFMVEMIETAYILNHATEHSLVLLDEVGRGTSTKDGLAIALATAEYLLNHNKSLSIFATHYFELTELSKLEGAFNKHVAVCEDNDQLIFLHKVIDGSTNKSYGLHVAKLAGIPNKVIELAYQHF